VCVCVCVCACVCVCVCVCVSVCVCACVCVCRHICRFASTKVSIVNVSRFASIEVSASVEVIGLF